MTVWLNGLPLSFRSVLCLLDKGYHDSSECRTLLYMQHVYSIIDPPGFSLKRAVTRPVPKPHTYWLARCVPGEPIW
jgi:hypothetical protein